MEYLDTCLAYMNATLATISSSHLKELHVFAGRAHSESLRSILAALGRLKDTDSLLAQSQFSHLQRVKLDFEQSLYMEDISDIPYSISPDGLAPDSDSSSQLCQFDHRKTGYEHEVFKCYAEGLIRRSILEKLFCNQVELQIKLLIVPRLRL